jgi:exosome complex component RRP41
VDIRSIEQNVGKAVESVLLTQMYPRTQIQIVLQELQSDGLSLAPAINGAMCALLESGLSLAGLLAAVTVAVDADQRLHLDPDAVRSQQAECCVTLVFARQSDTTTLVALYHDHQFATALLSQLLQLARPAVQKIYEFYVHSIRKRFVGHSDPEDNREQ